jgi:hypothetical protein
MMYFFAGYDFFFKIPGGGGVRIPTLVPSAASVLWVQTAQRAHAVPLLLERLTVRPHALPPGHDITHLGPETVTPERFSWIFSVLPAKFRNNILNEASIASFHISCDSLLKNHPEIRRYRPQVRAIEGAGKQTKNEETREGSG